LRNPQRIQKHQHQRLQEQEHRVKHQEVAVQYREEPVEGEPFKVKYPK
jgi:hypothetical protein